MKLQQAINGDVAEWDNIQCKKDIRYDSDELHCVYMSLNMVQRILCPANMVPLMVPEILEWPMRLR